MVESKNMGRRVVPVIVLGLIAVIAIAFLVIALQQQPRMLYPAEVREYEGEDLSSISELQYNAIRGIQHVNKSTYRLSVTGLVDRPLEFTYDEVVNGHQKYQKVVTLYCVEGWDATILWEGVLIEDLLTKAEVSPDAKVAIFHAADGYTTALPLTYLEDKDVLLAYKMNDIIIPPEKGFPFELVAESQYGYKWIKWVTEIEISDNENYLGYWESRGFPNNATLR